MDYEWDSAKAHSNEAVHSVPFQSVYDFDWQTALTAEDRRRDYGERRWMALGLIDDRLHALVFTRRERRIRVISLRKANGREVRAYEQATQTPDS